MKHPPPSSPQDDRYSEEETARRAEAVIKRMLDTPPRPHKAADDGRGGKALKPRKDKR